MVAGTDARNALDPQTLAKDVTALVSAGLLAQARALVVTRQLDGAAWISDATLAVRTRDSQEEFRTDAEYYLTRLLPDIIGSVTATSAAAGLVGALATVVKDGAESPDELLAATIGQFEDYQRAAAELSDTLTGASTQSAARRDTLEEVLKEQVDAVKGPEGEIQQTRDAIAETTKAIGEDLTGVVKAAGSIGGGVTTFVTDKLKLVTGVATKFGGGDSSGDGADGGGDSGSSPAEPFSVEDIDFEHAGPTGSTEASGGATELGTAIASFHAHNAKLADLYMRLARQNTSVAVAAAISGQADAFARGVQTAASAAAAVAGTWQRLLDAATSLAEADPAHLPAGLTTALTGAGPRWAKLATELTNARAALAGRRGAIPDVGLLPRSTSAA